MYQGTFWLLLPWIMSILLMADAFIIWEAIDAPPFGTTSHPAAFVAALGFVIGMILLVRLVWVSITSRIDAHRRRKR